VGHRGAGPLNPEVQRGFVDSAWPAFTLVDVDRSECQASGIGLVASFVRTRAGHDSMVSYEGLLRIVS